MIESAINYRTRPEFATMAVAQAAPGGFPPKILTQTTQPPLHRLLTRLLPLAGGRVLTFTARFHLQGPDPAAVPSEDFFAFPPPIIVCKSRSLPLSPPCPHWYVIRCGLRAAALRAPDKRRASSKQTQFTAAIIFFLLNWIIFIWNCQCQCRRWRTRSRKERYHLHKIRPKSTFF